MSNKRFVPMQVPPEFRKLLRKKAGEEDCSMTEYCRRVVKKHKKNDFFEW